MFPFQNLKENIKDKLCRRMEFRLYVNYELSAVAFDLSDNIFVYRHDGKSYIIQLDQYPQPTIERWLKEHLCNEDVDHVTIYKKRNYIFKHI